ncbi:hypothetical protein AZI86_14775 [Bdellovibrio bacteriovorus]|uniref:Lipoprotein n=1 Tax=Bdellovibrio bacteriovorus TaxID=959 RepID=A0A150WKF5_BDEBC|nr:hypothetical protein [Bdellovibrio bacteriovorus]KYG64065.1 hypothetical protein AZI86_14775 [Bdellovibrio bacteriovorus]
MKTSFLSKSVMGVLVLAALTLSACAKKDDSASGRVVTRGGSGIVTQNTCGNAAQAQAVGKIFDSQSYGSRFEEQVKAFVSATLDPEALGTISGNINDATGIDFTASFPFDSNNQLIAAQASISIKIFDSYAKTTYNGQVVPPYEVAFSQAKSGTINRNTRQINVVFEDEFGSITLTGTYDGSMVNGKVSFNNYKALKGSPQSGQLGDFRIYQCAMIH